MKPILCLLALLTLSYFLCMATAADSPPPLVTDAVDFRETNAFSNNYVSKAGGIFDETQSPPSQGMSLQEIPGLWRVKSYLYLLGYIKSPPPPYTNYPDGPFTSALQRYQKAFNLSVTGWIDDITLYQMRLPRCGVPDIFYNESKKGNSSWPHGDEWLKGRKSLTYGFKGRSENPKVMAVYTDAFRLWSNATGMNFTKTEYNDADIQIGFYLWSIKKFNQTLGDSVIESNGSVSIGKIRLDVLWSWVPPTANVSINWQDEVVDLGSAAMHQIGHLLGLGHSNVPEAVMYPYILPSMERKLKLDADDIDKFQNLHSSTSGDGRYTVMAVLSSFLVVFVCTVLWTN